MAPRTGWCLSSSGNGCNRCLVSIAGSSERSPRRCGDLLCGNSGRRRVSIKRGRRGGWRYVTRGRFFWPPLHLPVGELVGGCLLEEGVDW